MTSNAHMRPVYRRTIPRHHDLNPLSVTRWNRLLHDQTLRLNRARKTRAA